MDNLPAHLSDICVGLKTGKYVNEAAVSQGVVLRLLQALEWPVFDSQIVSPEHGVGTGRIDFALCYPPRKPIIFVEVKAVGQAGGADRQLFEYAFHEGIPVAILTDGQEWNFYLPAGQGHYEERRFYKLDLLERTQEECAGIFSRYLSFNSVKNGDAIENAKEDYKNLAKIKEIERVLPIAWKRILDERDSLLIDLISEKVESICGFRPNLETVSAFLSKISQVGMIESSSPSPQLIQSKKTAAQTSPQGKIKYIHFGKSYSAKNATDAVVQILRRFSDQDSGFFEKFSARKHGKKRRWLARDRKELYPDRPDLSDYSVEMGNGFYLGTNFANREKIRMLEIACEVAGIKFGKDLIISL